MEGFGELIGALGEFFGGVTEAAGEGAADAMLERVAGTELNAERRAHDEGSSTFARVLCGGRQTPNINDI